MVKNIKIYTVRELNDSIKRYLRNFSLEGIWVKGEILEYKLKDEGRYSTFLLCEKEKDSNRISAKVHSMCWGNKLSDIEEKLKSIGIDSLKEGICVQLKCTLDLWPQEGRYQIVVEDIEPSYTLGELHYLRQNIYNELKVLGLHEKNKKIEIPFCPIRVALVTSRGCAGFIDFISEIKLSPYAFIVDFYHASVQGQKVEEEIVATLKTIGNRFEQYDVLVIVRGGGAITDLKWFDNKNVGIAIANSPLPVLTGIGHEINLTVADMIANMNFKTPTAVASYLVNKVGEYERSLNALIKNIHESAGSLLDKSKREMVDLIGSIHHQTEQIVLDKKAELFGLIKDIVSETKPMLSSANASFSALNANIFKALPIYLKNKKAALANLDEKLRTYDPRKAIKLGYSITRNSRGVIIKRLGQVSSNDEIITNLIDGNILSVVAGKEGANGK